MGKNDIVSFPKVLGSFKEAQTFYDRFYQENKELVDFVHKLVSNESETYTITI